MLRGMRGFLIVWFGQLVSLLGTSMTTFGLTIWAFETTGRVTDLALISACYAAAMLVVSPFGGVIVDRYSRKLVMMASDIASGLATIAILILLASGRLAIWHLYVAALVQGAFQSMQWPASSAVITLMLPREHHTRANSLMEMAGPSSQILAPLLAGGLLGVIGLQGILLIDVITFLFAVLALLAAVVPQPSTDASPAQIHFLQEALFGFRYIWERPGLLGLQTVFLLGNFLFTIPYTLLAPMILSRTSNDELLLGSAMAIGAGGGVLGGIAISVWGGFRSRIYGVLGGWLVAMLAISFAGLGRGQPSWMGLPIWGAGLFVSSMASALINSSNQSIWQSKVPPALQGRVFSIRQLIAMGIAPAGALIAGPLADRVLEPGMQPGEALAGALGWLVGTGQGAGMSLAFILCGLAGLIVVGASAARPEIRDVECLLPDHPAAAVTKV